MKGIAAFIIFIHAVYSAKILGIFPTPSISHQVVFRALMKDLATRGHELIILTPDPFETDNPNVTQIDLHSSFLNLKFLNFEVFDAPVIEFTSLDTVSENHKWIGNEATQVVHPELSFPFQHKRLNFYERWKCLKFIIKRKLTSSSNLDVMNNFVKRHFPIENPDINKMRNRIELLMTNTHPALGHIRPILPNTIQLGFMHIEPPQPLKEGPLKNFLDNSKHGVIYMSFGSNVQSKDLGLEVKRMFLNTFKSLKYDFIWKFESDDLIDIPKNVMLQKWLPQADLLAHPSIKLFIAHGGQQSMEETIDRAVPTIVIPFLGDQDSNARRMETKKIGKHLELHTLTEEKLKEAIHEMLKPEYKKNIQKLRDLVYDEPMTTREKAVWWTEYVIRHKGAKHFYYHGKEVPFYEKYFLDFAAIGLIAVVTVIKLIMIVISMIFPYNRNKNKMD